MANSAVVYTKPGCRYCDYAKELLNDMDIPYTEHPIEAYKLNYLGSVDETATSPQIFLDGYHVGGYDDLYQHLLGGQK